MVAIRRLPENDRRRVRRSYKGHKNSYRHKPTYKETRIEDQEND